MTILSLQIPNALLLQSARSVEEITTEAQNQLALHYFRTGRLTSGQAAEMAGLNRVDFLFFAGNAGMPVADLDDEELGQEIQTIAKI